MKGAAIQNPGRFATRAALESRWKRVMPDGTRRPYECAYTTDQWNRVDRPVLMRPRGVRR